MRSCYVLALAAGCGRPGPAEVDAGAGAPDAPAAAPLVVVTINLRCLIDDWDARLPRLIEGLTAAGADVIGLQEVCAEPGGRDALEELVGGLGGDAAFARTTTHVAWDRYQEGLALVSRHPIAAVEVTSLPAGALPRKVIAAVIEAPGRRVAIASTHLDHLDPAVRAAQAEAAAAAVTAMAGADPVILVGDLNEAPGGGVGAALEAAGLGDAWAGARPGEAGPTFPASAPEVRIDYVWTDAVVAEIATVLDDGPVYASDHLGLRAVIAGE